MALKNKLVMVIDDDPDIRTLIRKILENLGVTVIEAEGVEQAFVLAASHAPHLVIVDLQMPGKNGFDFLEQRRHTATFVKVPVLVASSLRAKESIYRAIALGASDYLLKPFNASMLIQKVRKLLKDIDFKTYVFPKNELPRSSFSVGAEVTKVLDTGLMIESPIKVAEASPVQLRSEKLKEHGLSTYFFQTQNEPSVRGVTGRYFSRVNVIGLNESIIKKLRKPKAPTPAAGAQESPHSNDSQSPKKPGEQS